MPAAIILTVFAVIHAALGMYWLAALNVAGLVVIAGFYIWWRRHNARGGTVSASKPYIIGSQVNVDMFSMPRGNYAPKTVHCEGPPPKPRKS